MDLARRFGYNRVNMLERRQAGIAPLTRQETIDIDEMIEMALDRENTLPRAEPITQMAIDQPTNWWICDCIACARYELNAVCTLYDIDEIGN